MNAVSADSVLRIGTRRSLLAKSQTNWVIGELSRLHPQLKIEIVEVVTIGDKILDIALSKVPGKGVFVKEIEDKLLAGEIDLAVHSMKDLPTEFPDGLKIGAIPERVDPRDVFISRHDTHLDELPDGAKIGTSSLRRQAQLLKFRSDFEMVDIRGNIDTRLRKAGSEEYDGIILAAAGLVRLGWEDQIKEYLGCEVMIPAVGQGALGLEIRADDERTQNLISALNHPVTEMCVRAERTFLAGMGGGCQTPMGAFCRERGGEIVFQAFEAGEDGSNYRKMRREGSLDQALLFAEEAVRQFRPAAKDEGA